MIGELSLALMALAACGLVLRPLFSRPALPPDRAAHARAVSADLLAEIDRDRERGLISAREAESARVEIARRLLAEERLAETPGADHAGRDRVGERLPLRRTTAALLLVSALIVPALAGGLYLAIGSPGLPDQPHAAREIPATEGDLDAAGIEEILALITRLEARLEAEPGEILGWQILSQAYLRLNRTADAANAVDRAVALREAEGDPVGAADLHVDFGEAVMRLSRGQITPAAGRAFAAALALDPDNHAARYYRGLARLQAGEALEALDIWRALLASGPEDAPWRAPLEARIERMAPMERALRGNPETPRNGNPGN